MRAGRQSGHGLILLKNVILVDPLILLTLIGVGRINPPVLWWNTPDSCRKGEIKVQYQLAKFSK